MEHVISLSSIQFRTVGWFQFYTELHTIAVSSSFSEVIEKGWVLNAILSCLELSLVLALDNLQEHFIFSRKEKKILIILD